MIEFVVGFIVCGICLFIISGLIYFDVISGRRVKRNDRFIKRIGGIDV